jgi:hypothetical protein
MKIPYTLVGVIDEEADVPFAFPEGFQGDEANLQRKRRLDGTLRRQREREVERKRGRRGMGQGRDDGCENVAMFVDQSSEMLTSSLGGRETETIRITSSSPSISFGTGYFLKKK